MVLKKVTWPHEWVYMASGQPAVYEDSSITLFVFGYLAVMEVVKPDLKPIMARDLKELMTNAEVYGWAPVWTYHAIWLQQIVNGRAQWTDVDAPLEFRLEFRPP